jgi:hypothetical protein
MGKYGISANNNMGAMDNAGLYFVLLRLGIKQTYESCLL